MNIQTIAPNCTVVTDGSKRTLYSYDTAIAVKDRGFVTLDRKYWDYSKTTGKHRNIFLCETKKETEAKIKSGEYLLTDLTR